MIRICLHRDEDGDLWMYRENQPQSTKVFVECDGLAYPEIKRGDTVTLESK